MKLERLALVAAMIAITIAALCATENHRLQVRLAGVSTSSQPPLIPGPFLQPANLEQRLTKREAITPSVGQAMFGIQMHFAKLQYSRAPAPAFTV